jgi:hypothetical protein
MRLESPLLSLFSPFLLAALLPRFQALRARFAPPPPPPARPLGYALPLRVHVALRAAARARR